MIVNWTPNSLNSYFNIIDFLAINWTKKEINNFVSETEHTIELIKSNPFLFKKYSKFENVRKGYINKFISLYYRVSEVNKEVELLIFWDNRQNPNDLKL